MIGSSAPYIQFHLTTDTTSHNYIANGMSSFLLRYGRLLSILFYIGICPFKVHSDGSIRLNISFGYKLIISTVIITVLIIQIIELKLFVVSGKINTASALNYIQSLLNTSIYCFCILNSIIIGRSHGALLSGIQDFDRLINSHENERHHILKKITFESDGYFQRTFCIDLTAACSTVLLNFFTVYVTLYGWYYTRWMEYLFQYWYYWILFTFCLHISHMSNVAQFIRRRLDWACSTDALDQFELNSSAAKCLQYIELGWALKMRFEHAFGLTIMLNVTIDVFLLIIAFYYTVMYAVMRSLVFNWLPQGLTTVTYIVLPIARNVYLVWSVNGFGSEQVRQYVKELNLKVNMTSLFVFRHPGGVIQTLTCVTHQ